MTFCKKAFLTEGNKGKKGLHSQGNKENEEQQKTIRQDLQPFLPSLPSEKNIVREKGYLILLDIDARKRHHHVSEHGKIVGFMVQLEIKSEGVWKEVLRYDCAHGYAHKDCYNMMGKCRKINLFLHHEEALTLADDDINENWAVYRDRFLRGDFP